MGCAESNTVSDLPRKIQTNVGQLKVNVLNAHITHVTSTVA